jgi:hypothetical protein
LPPPPAGEVGRWAGFHPRQGVGLEEGLVPTPVRGWVVVMDLSPPL